MDAPIKNLIVVDPQIPNVDELLSSVPSLSEVYFLQGATGAVEQITELLTDHENLDSLHLFTHASQGQLVLAKERLGENNVGDFKEQLKQWQSSFEEGADLMLYGCDMGQEEGFIQKLAEYTSLDIAASDDVTGSTEFGGDAELEYEYGDIETGELFEQKSYDQFSIKLAQVEYTGGNTSSDLNSFITNDLNAGDTLIFNSAVSITFSSEIILTKSVYFVNASGGDVIFDGDGDHQLFDLNLSSNEIASFVGFVFTDAYADDGGDGGAIEMRDGNVIIKSSRFYNNTADDDGGAIQIEDGNLTIIDSLFQGNSSGDNGGAIDSYEGTINIVNTDFTANIADDDGGAISTHSDMIDITILNSDFTGNIADDDGGAIDKDGGGVLIIEGSSFTDNMVVEANGNTTEGGAINAEGGTTNINNSTFTNNSGEEGGAINAEYDGTIVNVSNSVFEDNTDDGGNADFDGGSSVNADDGGVININNSEVDGDNPEEGDGADDENFIYYTTQRKNSEEELDDAVVGRAAISPDEGAEEDGFDATSEELRGVDFFGEAAGDWSGSHIESAGDINNDGFDDFLIGSPYHDSGKGAAYLIFGSETLDYTDLGDIDETYQGGDVGVKINGLLAGDYLAEVGGVGDFNGDGIDDFILGARNSGGVDQGQAYLILGDEDETTWDNLDLSNLASKGFVLTGAFAHDDFAWQVTGGGDFDGDGYDDALISADRNDEYGTRAGAVYVIYGESSVDPDTNDAYVPMADLDLSSPNSTDRFLRISGNGSYSYTGYSVDCVGDVDGDGFDDIFIGAPGYAYSSYSEGWGEAYVVFGGEDVDSVDLSSLDTDNAGFTLAGKRPGGDGLEWTAYDVESAGDVNGDGFDDLLVGSASNYNEPGKVFVLFGNGDRTQLSDVNLNDLDETDDDTRGIRIISERNGDYAGLELSGAGDVNGDGFDDIMFASSGPYASGAPGTVYLILGSANPKDIDMTSADNFYGLIIDGIHEENELAAQLASAGDVDGDGFDDFLISEYFVSNSIDPDNSDNRLEAGGTYLIFGGNFVAEITNTTVGDNESSAFGQDNLVGTSGADDFDNISILDTVSSGAGDDVIAISSNLFSSIDGGGGLDTLDLSDLGFFSLDLRDETKRMKDIEIIDMIDGSADNELSLGLKNIMDLSNRADALIIHGDSGDQVNIEGLESSYTKTVSGGYDTYTYNIGDVFAEVEIQSGINTVFV